MRLVTWNINSVRLRIDLVLRLAGELNPDVICLQETKTTDDQFPAKTLRDAGYAYQVIRGMKGYNGVAILSKLKITASDSHPFCAQTDCRHVAATLETGEEIHCLYIPAGGDEPDPDTNPKFAHKLAFLEELADWCAALPPKTPRILTGDFNIAPLESDVWSHKQLLNVVSHTPVEVTALNKVQKAADWVDGVRHFIPDPERLYTWWSYRARDWQASNRGRRLDHIWVSPDLKPKLSGAGVVAEGRGWPPKPSDHAPVWLDWR